MSGVLQYCQDNSITFIAHSMLGGLKSRVGDREISRFKGLLPLATKHGISVHALVLAWAMARWPCILPIPGARSTDHIQDCQSASSVTLDEGDIAAFEEAIGSAP